MRLLLHYQLLTLLPFLLREFQIGDASIVAVDSLSSEGVTSTVSTSRGTCQFRTINYLTHGNILPSVCLRYSRPPSGTTIDLPFSTTETIESDSDRQFITTAITPTASAGLNSGATVSKKEFEDKGPLDESSFLSFEDWKKQRLEKEAPLDLVLGEQRPQILKDGDNDRRPGGISEALEALGDDDGEIQADFGAFITNRQDAAVSRTRDDYQSGKKLAQNTGGGDVKYEKQKHRIKDVGKTCKERFNFASIDAGGQIMKTNSEAKSASALLSENRDIYMLNICHAKNKFLVIELSELILVETVAIANFEFFSSTFRQFRVLVSDRYSVELEQWVELGIFEAKNSRDIQAFLIEDPRIWARYLRMEFLSHYGNEFYCPISLLRVHGRTMIQEIQDTLNMEQLSDVEDDGGGHVRSRDPKTAAGNLKGISEKFEENGVDEVPQQLEQTFNSTEIKRDIHLNHTTTPWTKSELILPAIFDRSPSRVMCLLSESPTAILTTQRKILSDTILPNCVTQSGASGVICLSHIPTTTELAAPAADPLTQSEMQNASFTSPSLRTTMTASANSGPTLAENVGAIGAIGPSVVSAVHIPQPTTQESFFKSVSKRLQQLEANSTLSLKYIEEQSRILRDAFAKVEKRQLSKTTSFLENLNDTVIEELRKFNRQYEQIWQSTVIELETQRDQSQREITAVSTRLNILADELVFQKRMSIIQSILLLLCLGLIIFSRGFAGLDMPIVQNIVTRSRSASRATVDGFNNDSVIQRADSFHSRSWLDPEYGRHKSDETTLSMRSNSQGAPLPLQLSEYSEETPPIRADGQDYLLRQDTGDPALQSIGR